MKPSILLLLALCCAAPASAQTDEDVGTRMDSYRKGVLAGFAEFRKGVLDDYDKFLDGVWKAYSSFVGEDRDPRPKPNAAPVAPPVPTPTAPVAQTPNVPEPEPAKQPVAEPTPVPPPAPMVPAVDTKTFSFYGITTKVPCVDYSAISQASNSDFAETWRTLKTLKIERSVLPALQQTATACRLNDWFFYELVETYAASVLGEATPAARIALMHYLMVHLGIDARVARTDNQPLLLLPMQQMVYARTYVTLRNAKYYVFTDRLSGAKDIGNSGLYTCDIPSDVNAGRRVDLLIRGLHMPDNPKSFHISYGGVQLSGKVNATVMEMLRHYPQMPVPDYARSTIDAGLRQSLVAQIKSQLSAYHGLEAANRLLHFVQSGFEYATDDEQHGYEKPYFVEETLYYPKCDCEDRAVFFAFLAKEALGIDNCLIHFPGHECTAIVMPGATGDGFQMKGRHYLITDPCYIGANVGACMPNYQSTPPDVELWY